MEHAVLVCYLGVGGAVVFVKNLLHAAGRVGIEHENLAEMRTGGLEEVQAIPDRRRVRLFMRKDDSLGIVIKLAEGDKTAPLFDDSCAGYLEALGVGVDGGRFFLGEDAEFLPRFEVARRARIDAFATVGIEEFGQPEDDAHHVAGTAPVIAKLHGGRDLVVRLSDDIFKTDRGGIVTPCAKRIEACHAEGLTPCQSLKDARWTVTRRYFGGRDCSG